MFCLELRLVSDSLCLYIKKNFKISNLKIIDVDKHKYVDKEELNPIDWEEGICDVEK